MVSNLGGVKTAVDTMKEIADDIPPVAHIDVDADDVKKVAVDVVKEVETSYGKSNEYLSYHYNNIGSTTLITNIKGEITDTFLYGIYGELLTKNPHSIRFLFNGNYGVITDKNGLHYMRNRYYNPEIKRFINQDSKVGDIS